MRNTLLKTAALSALTVAAFSTVHATTIDNTYTLNVAHTSDIPLTSDVVKGVSLTGAALTAVAAYLTNTNVNSWCATSSLCTAYSISSGEFRSNQNGGILKQLLQVPNTLLTVSSFSPPLPLNIKLYSQRWYELPSVMAFRFPNVAKFVTSDDVKGISSITASQWNSCTAVAFSVSNSYVFQNWLTYSQLPLPAEEKITTLTASSLYGTLQTMLQTAGGVVANSISVSNIVSGSYQMPSFTVYMGGSSDHATSAATVSILCKTY